MLGSEREHCIVLTGAGQVQHRGTGGEPDPRHLGAVALDRHGDAVLDHRLHDRTQGVQLRLRVDVRGGRTTRLRPHVDDVRTLGDLDLRLTQRRCGAHGDALAVGGVAREVDDPHQHGLAIGVDRPGADPEPVDGVAQVVGVPRGERGQPLEPGHGAESR